eukprot:scaffold2103_cov93-Skeletonema_marinoi.AAC.4
MHMMCTSVQLAEQPSHRSGEDGSWVRSFFVDRVSEDADERLMRGAFCKCPRGQGTGELVQKALNEFQN